MRVGVDGEFHGISSLGDRHDVASEPIRIVEKSECTKIL